MTALHFFYQRGAFGNWMPATSCDHPDTLTRDGRKIITTGHVELKVTDLGLTLYALALRYPLPAAGAPEIHTGPDQAEPHRQAVALIDPPAAWTDVLAERQRQVTAEGWTAEHDDQHDDGEMAKAAACYALHAQADLDGHTPLFWPWAKEWFKPTTERRDLVKAAALLLAEIERLDRAEADQP